MFYNLCVLRKTARIRKNIKIFRFLQNPATLFIDSKTFLISNLNHKRLKSPYRKKCCS